MEENANELTIIDEYFIKNDPDLFPSAMHYDDYVILNQDGCLMQTIEITLNQKNYCNLVEIIKNILKCFGSKIINFAFCINVLRRDSNLKKAMSKDRSGLYFMHLVQNDWNQLNNFKHGDVLSNHLYLTVIINNNIFSRLKFGDFFFFLLKSRFFKDLQVKAGKLHKLINSIVAKLAENSLQVEKLFLRKKDGKFYSDYLNFFHSLLFCEEYKKDVCHADFSHLILDQSKIKVDFNTIKISRDQDKIFTAVFAIKSDYYLSEHTLRKILTLPIFFNVTQTFNFVNNDTAAAEMKKQYKLLNVSQSKDLIKSLKIKESLQNNKDFTLGVVQATIFTVYGFTHAELQSSIKLLYQTCQECGVLINRLDVRLEEIFWSQLPGNLILTNYKNLYIDNYGCFLYAINEDCHDGKSNNLQYGKLLISDHNDERFSVNVISDNNKINFIAGQYAQIIVNFLTTFTMQENVRIILIDFEQKSRLLFNILGYKYFRIVKSNKAKGKRVGLNLLSLCGSEIGNEYLIKMLILMIEKQKNQKKPVDSNELKQFFKKREVLRETLQEVAQKITNDESIHCLSDCQHLFKEVKIDLGNWLGDGDWSGIFDNDFTLEFENDSIAFDFTEIDERDLQGIISDFLLCYVQKDQVNQKTLFIINDFLSLYDQSTVFHERLSQAVVNLEKLGIFPIFVDTSYQNLLKYKDDDLMGIVDSFFLTQGENLNEVIQMLNINQKLLADFKEMSSFNDRVIFAYDDASHVLKLDLSKMKECLFFTSNDVKVIDRVKKLKKEHGKDVKNWLNKFYENASV